ncbi:trimeric intracellular cation channel family protein [Falsihalocynthiibacter sp. S25ZX9]|uniref:trimeric intracellular cation channel family protein n=1 Tax=unclassified Falsihalocynthiibacter TaxID=2854191 RepID=UPI00350FE96C
MSIVIFLDFIGVTLFAVTGALVASRKQLDIIGFIFLAMVTGTGGGTVRDLILGVPVFWVEQPLFILVCTVAAVVTFFIAHFLESRYLWLLWLDAAALAAYAVFGAYKGLLVTGSPVIAVVMGVLTGGLGGVFRDILASEPSVLMRKDIYLLAAMVGGLTYVGILGAGVDQFVAAGLGFILAFLTRSGALAYGWSMPVYRSRPGRDPEVSLDAANRNNPD